MSDPTPGDIAIATFRGEEGVRVFRYDGGWARCDNPDDFVGDDNASSLLTYIRKCIVLREPLARVVVQYLNEYADTSNGGVAQACDQVIDEIDRQLRAPVPREPVGLGAAVEDRAGLVWLRTRYSRRGDVCWALAGKEALDDVQVAYDEIDAVTIVSEGTELR